MYSILVEARKDLRGTPIYALTYLPYQKYFVDFNKISYYILELKGLVKAATVTCNEIRESIMLLPTTLSALIMPALIPPHFANVAVIRAGGRKGRRKKGQGTG